MRRALLISPSGIQAKRVFFLNMEPNNQRNLGAKSYKRFQYMEPNNQRTATQLAKHNKTIANSTTLKDEVTSTLGGASFQC